MVYKTKAHLLELSKAILLQQLVPTGVRTERTEATLTMSPLGAARLVTTRTLRLRPLRALQMVQLIGDIRHRHRCEEVNIRS